MSEIPNFRTLHSTAFRGTNASIDRMMNVAKYVDFGKKSGFNLRGYYSPEDGAQQGSDDNLLMLEQLYRNNVVMGKDKLESVDMSKYVTFCKLYTQYKDTFHYKDYTDLLEDYIARKIVEDVDVVFIDEAQDLTTLQWRFAFSAFRNVKRAYIAGDDDQAVYSFAGADVNTFISLKSNSVVLDHSYRLPQNFVDIAKNISKYIGKRYSKDYNGEHRRGVTHKINSIDELDINDEQTYFLLARNNWHLRKLKEYCIERVLPFTLKGEPFISDLTFAKIERGQTVNLEPDIVEYAKKLMKKDLMKNPFIKTPKINISTIHGVKGGEADHVVLLTDITRETHRNLNRDGDSEHRIFYVGVTRAKKELTVVLPSTKFAYNYITGV
jgi:superfamily I DNA/RNA helicase